MPRYLVIRIDSENVTTGDYPSERPWQVGETLTGDLEGFDVAVAELRELGPFDGLLSLKEVTPKTLPLKPGL